MNILCILPLSVCSHPEDWEIVQSVGGLEPGAESVSEGNWSLTVRVNVSGLEKLLPSQPLLTLHLYVIALPPLYSHCLLYNGLFNP